MSQNSRPDGLREVVVDVIQTPAEYEKAVEAVLGEKLQSMIVNSYSDTLDVIRYMNEHHSGRGSFIPLNLKSIPLKPVFLNGDQGVVGKLADLVETREEYKSVFEHLLNNVVLVRDLGNGGHARRRGDRCAGTGHRRPERGRSRRVAIADPRNGRVGRAGSEPSKGSGAD
jgi:chromosome segregation protein